MRSLLRWACRVLAIGLVGLVLAAPRLAPDEPSDRLGARTLRLFASDPTLRQVSVASAVGLLLTAQFFFAPKRKPLPPLPPPDDPAEEPPPPPPPRRE